MTLSWSLSSCDRRQILSLVKSSFTLVLQYLPIDRIEDEANCTSFSPSPLAQTNDGHCGRGPAAGPAVDGAPPASGVFPSAPARRHRAAPLLLPRRPPCGREASSGRLGCPLHRRHRRCHPGPLGARLLALVSTSRGAAPRRRLLPRRRLHAILHGVPPLRRPMPPSLQRARRRRRVRGVPPRAQSCGRCRRRKSCPDNIRDAAQVQRH
jgi:hypothetical protein